MRNHHRPRRANGAETVEQLAVRRPPCDSQAWKIVSDNACRYGVTRVYAQQCSYVLTDTEAAKTGMRAVFKSLRADELEAAGAHKGR